MKMGLREANQNFSKAIKAIKSGKAIVLTERGKPIATITPIVDETATRVFSLDGVRAASCAKVPGRFVRRAPPFQISSEEKEMKTDACSPFGIFRYQCPSEALPP